MAARGGFSELIEAFTIFRKYGDTSYPTHCEHDVMRVLVGPERVSQEDKDRLEQLGFTADEWNGDFYTFRYGSG
jgi:hypothetical protein